jgi:hypothetical protein
MEGRGRDRGRCGWRRGVLVAGRIADVVAPVLELLEKVVAEGELADEAGGVVARADMLEGGRALLAPDCDGLSVGPGSTLYELCLADLLEAGEGRDEGAGGADGVLGGGLLGLFEELEAGRDLAGDARGRVGTRWIGGGVGRRVVLVVVLVLVVVAGRRGREDGGDGGSGGRRRRRTGHAVVVQIRRRRRAI